MVFKVISMTTLEAARWIAALSVISAFIWSVGGFIALTLWNVYRDDIVATAGLATQQDVLQVESALAEAAKEFTVLSRQILVLSRPDALVIYRELPSAVGGFCEAGKVCAISVFAERSQRALECRILGAKSELLLLIDGREYVGLPIRDRDVTNLDSRPRALEPRFSLPRGIPIGKATAIIRSYYTDCFWQINGEPPAIQDSPTFQVEIRPNGDP